MARKPKNATYRAKKRARQELAAAAAAESAAVSSPGPSSATPATPASSQPPPPTTTTNDTNNTANPPKKPHRRDDPLHTLKHIYHIHKRFRSAVKSAYSAQSDINSAHRALKAEIEALKKSQQSLIEAAEAERNVLRGQLRELNSAVNFLLKVKPEEMNGEGEWYDQVKGEWRKWERME